MHILEDFVKKIKDTEGWSEYVAANDPNLWKHRQTRLKVAQLYESQAAWLDTTYKVHLDSVYRHVAKEMFEKKRGDYTSKQELQRGHKKYLDLDMKDNNISQLLQDEMAIMKGEATTDVENNNAPCAKRHNTPTTLPAYSCGNTTKTATTAIPRISMAGTFSNQ